MKYRERIENFEKVRSQTDGFLAAVLWKLTGDRELFAEAMQYALTAMWENIHKINDKNAHSYLYRIALTANSKAWRHRAGKNGQITHEQLESIAGGEADRDSGELMLLVRKAISRLPEKQSKAIVMRYLQQQEYDQIAADLDCCAESARSHVSKALASLKKNFSSLAGRMV